MRKHYLNLSNGVEALAQVRASGEPFAFARFRSTTLERGDYWTLLETELSDDLLMHLALGWECVLHDRGTRRPVSKTCFLGVPLVRYVVHRRWNGREPVIAWQGSRGGPGLDRTAELREIYATHVEARDPRGGRVRARLDYFGGLAPTEDPAQVRFVGCSQSTERDGDRAYQRELAGLLRA